VRGASHLLDEPAVKDLLSRYDRANEPLATTLSDLDASVAAQRSALLDALADADGGIGEPDDGGPLIDESHVEGRRLGAMEQILRLGRDLLTVEPTARTDAFGGWLRTTLQEDGLDGRDAVSIVSFHAAKGLEWPVVHLAGVEAGLVPITHARAPEERAEEQRLFYVAVTRAADVLRCTWAAQRTYGSQTYDRKPSPYLAWIRDAVTTMERATLDAPDPRPALSASRAALDAKDGPGADLVAAHRLRSDLQQWRAHVARQADVAPTVVLSDKALESVVRVRPLDLEALAGVRDVGPSVRERHGTRLVAIVAGDDHTKDVRCASN